MILIINTLKAHILILIIALSLPARVVAQDSEEEKIIDIINLELESYLHKDEAKWASFWKQTEDIKRIYVTPLYYRETIGWDSLSASLNDYFATDEPPGIDIEKSDFDIRVINNIAIVHLVQKFTQPGYDPGLSHQVIILEKINDNWKFTEIYSFFKSFFENNDQNIEYNLNAQGYRLLDKERVEDAIKVFQLNTELFPSAWNTWDSLAEAYMIKGDSEKAIEYYQKSLDLNPDNENAKKYLASLKK